MTMSVRSVQVNDQDALAENMAFLALCIRSPLCGEAARKCPASSHRISLEVPLSGSGLPKRPFRPTLSRTLKHLRRVHFRRTGLYVLFEVQVQHAHHSGSRSVKQYE